VCFSFSKFLVFFNILGPTLCISHFPCFSVFIAIFQVRQCAFHLFHVFPFSCHIPGLTVCISHFPSFSVFFAIFRILQCVFLSFKIFSFLAIFRVLQYAFLIFHVFQCFSPFSKSDSVHFSFSKFFQCFFPHIPGITLSVYHFQNF
jgi:hypothetical protein